MTRADLVIFDCDGVLIDSEVISARMLIAELARHGVHVDMAYVARHFLGRSYPVVLAQIRAEYDVILPEGFEAAYRARLIDAFRRDLKVMPHVTQVIDRLGTPYHLATSSSPERLRACLEITGLDGRFAGRITTASEVARGKPAPDLFLHVAALYNTPPERCIVIEDSQAGLRAARAAGMQVWHFIGGSHLTGLGQSDLQGEGADRQFASFDQFFHLAPELVAGEPDRAQTGQDG